MTRKEASDMIRDDICLHHNFLSGKYRKALRMAIDVLEKLPDNHGRLVDADALEPDADYYDGDYWAYSVAQVCNAPTIVESEDGS